MSELLCTGLRGSHPLGVMAAFGLLRVASGVDLPQPVRLSWREGADWQACLHFPVAVSRDEVLTALAGAVMARTANPPLPGQTDMKLLPETLAQLARDGVATGDEETMALLAAVGSEAVTLGNRPEVKPTGFYMLSGQQRFFSIVRELTALLAAGETTAALTEALFGPWRYRDPVHALGWDPEAERLHALQAQSPTKKKAQNVAGAVWLGVESLPLWPVVARDGRLWTTGFREASARWLSWPVWTAPIDLATLRSVLTLADLHEETPDERCLARLRGRGIAHVFRARRVPVGDKGYMIFRPADLVC